MDPITLLATASAIWSGILWDSPVPYPDDGERYTWDEETQSWVKITGV
jgi:hypothetical protein